MHLRDILCRYKDCFQRHLSKLARVRADTRRGISEMDASCRMSEVMIEGVIKRE